MSLNHEPITSNHLCATLATQCGVEQFSNRNSYYTFSKNVYTNFEVLISNESRVTTHMPNTDTMWHTENRIPRYKPQTTTKSIPKFSALHSNSLARTPATENACMQKKLKALILVLGLLQVVGTVKTI